MAHVVDAEVSDGRTRLRGDHLPGNHVRRVLGEPDEDLVAGTQVLPAPGRGHQVQPVGGAAREDDLRGAFRIDELRHRAPRILVRLRGSPGEGMECSAGVCVRAGIEPRQRFDDRPRSQRGGRRVQVDQRTSVDALLEGGEEPAPVFGCVALRHAHGRTRLGRGRQNPPPHGADADGLEEFPAHHANQHMIQLYHSRKSLVGCVPECASLRAERTHRSCLSMARSAGKRVNRAGKQPTKTAGLPEASRPAKRAARKRRWLLLIHQLPPEPAYIRVKVRRRLQKLGAVALKSSVYVLPESDAHREDFQWLANEIVGDGGEATICAATFLAGTSDADIERLLAGAEGPRVAAKPLPSLPPKGSVWVTRRDVFVDRMASAWLIKRFIDTSARFRFVSARNHRPRRGEVHFDMYGGEFTHEGDRCTFEVLVERFQLGGRTALRAIAEIVHDLDLKDDRFRRPETPGVLAVMQGIVGSVARDADRLARSASVFDGLHDRYSSSG